MRRKVVRDKADRGGGGVGVKKRKEGVGVINLAATGGNTLREWGNLQNTTNSFI